MDISRKVGSAILIFWISFIQIGCKTSAAAGYSLQNANKVAIRDVAFVNPQVLTLNNAYKSRINSLSPTLAYPDGASTLNSFYKTMSTQITSPGRYQIEVQSLCDCAGFNKYLFIPQLELNSPNLELSHVKTNILNENLTLPKRMQRVWELDIEEPEKLEFILYSDNSKLDEELIKSKSIALILSGVIGAFPINYTIKAGFQGKYIVKITKV